MFEGLEPEFLKSAPVEVFAILECFCEKYLDMFNLRYELLAMGAPDWRTIFKDWPNISAIRSGQYLFIF